MGCGSSVDSGSNAVIQANNEPFQGKLAFDTPQSQPSQPAHQTYNQPSYTQPPAVQTNNQQNFSQYQPVIEVQPVQQHQQEQQFVHTEQQAPQFHTESRSEQKPPQQVHIESREKRAPEQSYGESRGEEKSSGEGKPVQSYGESRGEAKPPHFGEAKISGESKGERPYVAQSESKEVKISHQEAQYETQQEGVVEKTLVQPDMQEMEDTRETEYGVSYNVGETSKVLKSISVEANEGKGHTAEIEAKIRKENTHLKQISVSFQSDETENMDYFISGLLRTSSYSNIFLLLNSLTNFSNQGIQGCGQAIAAMNQLETFRIMQCHTDATDSFFATVLPGVKNHNKTLKTFKLDFVEGLELTDETVKYIKEAIEANELLDHVGIYFGKTKMTNHAIEHMKNALKNKPNLQSLELGFLSMPQLTDACLQTFKEMIRNLPKLKRLDMILMGAGFSEEAANKFETETKSLPLENFQFMWKEPVYEEMSG